MRNDVHSTIGIRGTVIVVRKRLIRPDLPLWVSRWIFHNIVTDAGDEYYAQEAADEAALFTVAGMRCGDSMTGTPAKADVKLQSVTGGTLIAASAKAIAATYPKTDDADADNTGAAVDAVTWLGSWIGADFNDTDINCIDTPDSLTDGSITMSLNISKFGSSFAKTATDSLKIFVNHTFTGS